MIGKYIATISIVTVLVFSYLLLSDMIVFPSEQSLSAFELSIVKPYNLFFYELVHSGYSHLFANLFLILLSGIVLEPIIGRKSMLLLFAGAVSICGLAVVLVSPQISLVGASGGGIALLTAAFIADPKKAFALLAASVIAIFLVVSAVNFIVEQKNAEIENQIETLEGQKAVAAQNNDYAAVQAASEQILQKEADLEGIRKAREAERATSANFMLHVAAAFFGIIYMYIFHKKIAVKTSRLLKFPALARK